MLKNRSRKFIYLSLRARKFLNNSFKNLLSASLIFSQISLSLLVSTNDAKALTANGNVVDIDYIVPDRSTNTITDRATSDNTPIINIAAPSGAGVSLNNFTKFNVTNEDAIFNNSRSATVHTDLSGEISGNQNLMPAGISEARIIIGQVTGTERTNLNGYVEIAGRQAELIIANPNGMEISGAGFYNVSRLSLITGIANMAAGNIIDFTLGTSANSNIIITGINTPTYANLGLDASNVDYVDIISRYIEVDADIRGKDEINIKTGNDKFNYATKEVTSDASITSPKPEFALDSTHLGGMYAGRIKIIASEAGVGVRARGDLESDVSNINLEADGNIEYERLQAANDINITSKNGDITQGKHQTVDRPALASAVNDVNITADNGNIELNGDYLSADNDINIVASLGNIVNNTDLDAVNDINILASLGNIVSISDLDAINDINLTANNGDITLNSGLISAGNSINLLAENHITSGAELAANTDINITSNSGNIELNGDYIFAGNDINLLASTGNITNNTELTSDNNINITANNFTNNKRVISFNDLNTLISGNLTNQNGGLLLAGNDINFQVSGNLTNDASEIYAFNNVYLNGEIYQTEFGNVSKYDFFSIIFDKGDEIWADLIAQGWIDANGNLTDAFKELGGFAGLTVDGEFTSYQENIFRTLEALSPKLATNGDSFIGGIQQNFDDRAADIYAALVDQNYIVGDELTQKFYDDTKTNGAGGLNLGTDDLNNFQADVYDLLVSARTGLIIENTFLGIDPNIDSQTLINDLLGGGYINEDGTTTALFDGLGNSSELINLDPKFNTQLADIFNTINSTINTGKIVDTDFNGISQTASDAALLAELQSQGYINGSGIIQAGFTGDIDDFNVDSSLAEYKTQLFNIVKALQDASDVVELTDLNSVIATANPDAILTYLTDNNYIDASGNVDDKYYTDGLSVNGALSIYQSDIESKLAAIQKESINTNSLKKINKSLDSSVDRLVSELWEAGYIDDFGKKTQAFADLADSSELTLSDEFNGNATLIYNTIVAKDAAAVFSGDDFLGTSFDANVFFNENQELFNDLVSNGYLTAKGDIKQAFYDLGGNYSNLVTGAKFNVLKDQIGELLSVNLNTDSFTKLETPLDNSVNRLVIELYTSGYIDGFGKKTQAFIDLADSSELNLSAEFTANATLIYDTVTAKDVTATLSGNDFLGASFDANVFFDENQELFDDLVSNGYLDTKGNIKQDFYDLGGDYTILATDAKFSALKDQIGGLLENLTQANVTADNLVEVAQNNTKTQAGLLFDKLYNEGYVNIKGDYTQKLMDEVLNFSANDITNYNQLQLGTNLQEHAEGVYNSLKNNNGILDVISAGNSINNINGGRIESLFGNVFIKTKTLNNIGKDSIDVSIASNIESAISGRRYDNLRRAWKNTVLDSRDYLKSELTTEESYIISANNMDIEADTILNNSSWITAANDMEIRTTNLQNKRTQFVAKARFRYESHWKRCSGGGFGVSWSCRERRWWSNRWVSTLLQSNTAAIISAGNNLTINAINNVLNDIPTEDNASLPIAPVSPYGTINQPEDNDDITISLPPENSNGLFVQGDPDSEYLVETNLRFLDPDILTGSKYFKDRLGFDPNIDGTRFLGDPFYEWKLVNDQIRAATKKQRNWDLIGWADNLNGLIANGFDVMADLELSPGISLTDDQIAALDRDIIWYEKRIVNGEEVLVPIVYLASNSFNNFDLNNGSMILANNVNIKTNDLINSGNILAANLIDVDAANDITNRGGNIHSQNVLILKADNDINNEAIVNTINIKKDIFSDKARSSGIKSGGAMLLDAGNDFNNFAADVTSGADMTIMAGDDINIGTLAVRNRTEYSNKESTVITDKISNLSSNITSAGSLALISTGDGEDGEFIAAQDSYQKALGQYEIDLAKYEVALAEYKLGSRRSSFGRKAPRKPTEPILSDFLTDIAIGSNVFVTGSNLVAKNDLNISSSGSTIITNAIDSDYYFRKFKKKGSIKTVVTTQADYVENAVKSNLAAKNINIVSGGNIFIQASDLNSKIDSGTGGSIADIGGNTNLIAAGDTVISNANLQEYHHFSKQVSNRGLYKGVTAITSAAISLGMLSINLGMLPTRYIAKGLGQEDLYKKVSRPFKQTFSENQWHNTKVKTTDDKDLMKVVSASVIADNDLSIDSGNDVTVIGSSLIAGAGDNDEDNPNSNPNITGTLSINASNLNIYAASNYRTETNGLRTKRTFTIKDSDSGTTTSQIVNSNLEAKNNDFVFNITNKADIKASNLNDPILVQPSYLIALKEQLAPENISEENLEIVNRHWDETNRQLTDTGVATIAVVVAAVVIAISVLTFGTGAGPAVAAGTAVVSAAASTAAISATQASMNAEGDFWKQAKDINKTTWDDTTSRDAFESYLIAGATAALTAGLLDWASNSELLGSTINAGSLENATRTERFLSALAKTTISTTTSTAVQSAINGDSFDEAFKNQLVNIIIAAAGSVAANEIGTAAKIGDISRVEQYALHAILGCGMAAAGGNDCASGAMSGVIGEIAGEALYGETRINEDGTFTYTRTGMDEDTAIRLAGLIAGYSAIFTGNAVGLSDEEIADNIFSGQGIGENAVENNLVFLAPLAVLAIEALI
ncbi:MAG: filamentous hemagglutinin, partial [Lentimonas sp.]